MIVVVARASALTPIRLFATMCVGLQALHQPQDFAHPVSALRDTLGLLRRAILAALGG